MDGAELRKFVEPNLAVLSYWERWGRPEGSPEAVPSGAEINMAVEILIEIVKQGITRSTLWARPSFTPEC